MKSDIGGQLMLRYQETGDRESGHKLYELYREDLWRFLFWLTADREDTDDLAQLVWLKVIEAAENGRYRRRATVTFRTFLFTVARNAWIDRLRGRQKRKSDSSFSESHPDVQDATALLIEECVDMTIWAESLSTALRALPDDQREVILLWATGFTYGEIANIVGAGESTVVGRKRYAIEKLKHLMARHQDARALPM